MANPGNSKWRRSARSGLLTVPADVIPPQPAPPRPSGWPADRHFQAREHRRRDIGSQVVVLDLAAPDSPAGAPAVPSDQDGTPMEFLVRCVTHGEQKYFKAYGSACRGAKASHQWCEACKKALVGYRKLHSKANARPAAAGGQG